MQWEYHAVTYRADSDPEVGEVVIDKDRLRKMNELGAEGWELVTVTAVSREDLLWAVTYVYKRPVGGDSEAWR
jgi:hypothetical protein